ncbi:PEP-CTERM sorting domain-containing protein [Marinobacter subterrani]|uniref:PEP-CTERM protein-sorting domain n=1 Tax=Marinobacter subterrani TaxID=1658765 RepID=A0A0J7J9Q0_9GAMM|nr:PEP-CTERM sorting domain-containing protein [Marinobacter subterrani]KMQ74601.1 PEP-CTERM protein-sorting domain [Marinobacter subterrani]
MGIAYKKLGAVFARAGILASILMAASSFLIPSITEASIITVDPGDYAEGADLSNVSPFVTLQYLDGSYGSYPIKAKRSFFSGDLTFGTMQSQWVQCVGRYECAQGFGMAFTHSPRWVSFSMTLTNIVLSELSTLVWHAFDEVGDEIAWQRTITYGLEPGQFYSWNIAVPNMKYLVVGGGGYPSPGEFNQLSFAVGVAEPSALALFSLGLMGLFFKRRVIHLEAGLRNRQT